ncbi:hypothetical protein SAMN05216262_11226 [Colwellia chukchiensis]|uniref:MOSC domain-containing protein n=1 Tax=Colwellia chukchiensis TaxID=641665 RepID=A0A1H7QL37_9GAMM|nr:YcbX family protein [Colwellia chukchiensis]SEL48840.1 hypothetical protein SAMN05216262_11226 [Colwellia chukchiensis]
MQQANLSSIHVYPIKSSAGVSISTSWVEEFGLALDRRFVITDPEGVFISARTEPSLCLIQANITASGLIVTAPNMPTLVINYQQLAVDYTEVIVWGDTISAQQCSVAINSWFSRYLQRPCQLLFFGASSQRFVKDKTSQVGFADGYPLLLISQASLDSLNRHYLANSPPIAMAQFRPNLVVENCPDFAEDTWQHIRIGEVEFEVSKPCARCIFTTVNPNTGIRHPAQEPLATLKKFRQVANGDILFGQNLIALNQGQIKCGDSVEVLKQQRPPSFTLPPSTKNASTKPLTDSSQSKSKPLLTFKSFNKTVRGNNQQSILAQGEDAGLLLPYSCRAGMCGSCKVKLEQGQVQQACQDGLSDAERQQGYILSCSSTPLTDVVISHPKRNVSQQAKE